MLPFQTIVKRFSAMTLVSLGLAVLAPACAGSTLLDPDDYDHSCQTVDDCVDVLVGDMCSCGCQESAISKSDLPKFNADDAAARGACDANGVSCFPCPAARPLVCESGTCGFATP